MQKLGNTEAKPSAALDGKNIRLLHLFLYSVFPKYNLGIPLGISTANLVTYLLRANFLHE